MLLRPISCVLLASLAALVFGARRGAAEVQPANILLIHMEDMGVQIPAYGDFKVPEGKAEKGSWRPAFEVYDGPDRLHGDYQTADQAIRAIEENRDEPFFIAAGFYKPHLPFVAPKRFWDLYQNEEIKPLEPQAIPRGAQRYQYSFREICAYGLEPDKLFTPEKLVNTELYDLGLIGAERTNIADDPEQMKVLEACRALMGAGYATLRTVE